MILIDTSILVPILRERGTGRRERFRDFLRGAEFLLTRFTQTELLQGCASELQWDQLYDYLEDQEYIEFEEKGWVDAARIVFDLRKKGLTVRSIFDCCIAQIAIENRLTLVHNDKDFEAIAKVRPLRQQRLDLQ
jgi:predicted nucleic acid-binding protein